MANENEIQIPGWKIEMHDFPGSHLGFMVIAEHPDGRRIGSADHSGWLEQLKADCAEYERSLSEQPKVVSLTGDPIQFATLTRNQLFTPRQVFAEAPVDEFDQVIVIARSRDFELYIGSTHATPICSELLGQAAHLIHGAYRPWGAEDD